MSKDQLAYILGAYVRSGKRKGKNRIIFSAPVLNQLTHTINSDLFSKEFTIGPSLQWIEDEKLIDKFLEGFMAAPPGKLFELHTEFVERWLKGCGTTLEELDIKHLYRYEKLFKPTPSSLPLIHGIYWCKHKIIKPNVAELGPLPEDVFKYLIKKLNISYRSRRKIIQIYINSLDLPGLPKPQCLSTPEDYKDFNIGWYEGEPPEQLIIKFNKWEYLNAILKSR